MQLIAEFETREECCDAERNYIRTARQNKHKLLNIADGGDGGFVVTKKEEWRKKLSQKRKGKKPALGMKHTEENKKFFPRFQKNTGPLRKPMMLKKYAHFLLKRQIRYMALAKLITIV